MSSDLMDPDGPLSITPHRHLGRDTALGETQAAPSPSPLQLCFHRAQRATRTSSAVGHLNHLWKSSFPLLQRQSYQGSSASLSRTHPLIWSSRSTCLRRAFCVPNAVLGGETPTEVCIHANCGGSLPRSLTARSGSETWPPHLALIPAANLGQVTLSRLFIFFNFGEGKGRRKRGRETSMGGCLSRAPYWGPGPQSRHVPWLEVEPMILWFTGRHSIH